MSTSPIGDLEFSLVDAPDGPESFLHLSIQCRECFGSGLDQTRAPGGMIMAGLRADQIQCQKCGGRGRLDKWLSVYALQQFVIAVTAGKTSEIFAALKEESVRALMEE